MTDTATVPGGAFAFPVIAASSSDVVADRVGGGVTFAALPAAPEPGPSALEVSFAAELDRIRAQAREQGYADGFAAGTADGHAQVQAAVAEATAQAQHALDADRAATRHTSGVLAQAVTAVQQTFAPTAEDMAATLGQSAYALAEAIIGRELDESVSAAADAVARALRLCPADGPVTVRVHPDDLNGIRTYGDPLDNRFALITDPTIERGGAVASFGASEVDAQISGALARAKKVLGA